VVEGLTKSAALEVAGSGVRVNAVAPGPTDTALLDRFAGNAAKKEGLLVNVPLKRLGTPEEIAQVIVFLASDRSSFVSGHILSADGGKVAR
jgi:NAD(P)-dependent dehydrogenase (short-subunit alcohol dehydrogenase family)